MADRHAVEASIVKGAEAIDMREEGSHGVLLLHGFGDTPQTLSHLTNYLSKSGISVFVPLLRVHGRSIAEFTKARANDWVRAAEDAVLEMQRRYTAVSV